jgi:glycosyltransferase involved in cell wall biosynthesis
LSEGVARPRVLLVTGAYHPEISASGVQCRAVAACLRGRAEFSVLTTAGDAALPSVETIDGVVVRRVHVDVGSRASKAAASAALARQTLQASRTCDIIHVHGFSQKNVPVWLLGRLLGKRIVLSLHTAGQDEPAVVKRQGALAFRAFRSADLVLSVSPLLADRWREGGLPADRVRLAPNGVDTTRFRPADEGERKALRRSLGWSDDDRVVVFVGFFSRDKRPDLLFRAWRRVRADGVPAKLAFIGAKGSTYYEIDSSLAGEIRRQAAETGLAGDVRWVEPTHEVERYLRAADLFVLPSIREAHPLALLEAMACGLPCVATHLPGATDILIEEGRTGRLFRADDEAALAGAMRDLLTAPAAAAAIGGAARAVVLERYDVRRTAETWRSAYEAVLTTRP